MERETQIQLEKAIKLSQKLTPIQSEIFKFQEHLKNSGEYEKLLKKLERIGNYNEVVLFLEGILKQYGKIPDFGKFTEKKDQKKSDSSREDGNKFYEKRDFMVALEFYNKRFDLIFWIFVKN
jgi:hypothetical protein